MAYDVSCYRLAELFLAEEPELQTPEIHDALAQHIQTTIEDWIIYETLRKLGKKPNDTI
jgi:hypothetical protein